VGAPRGGKIAAGAKTAHFGSVFDAKHRPKKSPLNTFTFAVARPEWPILALMGAPLVAPGFGKCDALKRRMQRKAPVRSAGQKPTVLC
jgi:hypothetical protein